ncbi:Serine incorporator 4, partial [Eschrichtius robustus]|nr:Serine incorporator 4 [Eschrichtius robustus]
MVGAKAVTSPSTSLRLAQQRSGVCSVIVSLPFYQMPSGLCAHLFGHSHCPVLSGSGAVYRVCAGTATFHLLQAVLLVDLHSPTSLRAQLHKRQTGAAQDCPSFLAVLLTTLGFYSMAGVAAVLLFHYYTHPDGCLLNKMLLSLHLCCCGLLSFLSIAPCIRLSGYMPCNIPDLGDL